MASSAYPLWNHDTMDGRRDQQEHSGALRVHRPAANELRGAVSVQRPSLRCFGDGKDYRRHPKEVGTKRGPNLRRRNEPQKRPFQSGPLSCMRHRPYLAHFAFHNAPRHHLAGASMDLFVGGVWNLSFGPESMVTTNQIIKPTTVNTAHQTMICLIVRSEASMERR
jgi:hypothetical protein